MAWFGLKKSFQFLSSHRMFTTLRLYRLNPIFERDFIKLWNELIEKLKDKGFVKDAVLHKESKITYISYLRWTSNEHMDNVLNNPVEKIEPILQKIKECCNSITVLHRMYTISETLH